MGILTELKLHFFAITGNDIWNFITEYFWLLPIFVSVVFLIISFITDWDLGDWGSILIFFGVLGIIGGGVWLAIDVNNISIIAISIGGLALILGIVFKAIDDMWDIEEWRIFGIILSTLAVICGIIMLVLSFKTAGLYILISSAVVLVGLVIWLVCDNGPYFFWGSDSYEDLDYEDWTVQDLKDECRIRGLSGYSKLRKNELISLLESDDNDDLDEQNDIMEKKLEPSNIKVQPINKNSKNNRKIRLENIAGLDEAKQAIYERVILPIKHKDLYEKYRKKIGGGILLYGLPGTGKTMFAQAVANELDAAFYEIKCSDLMSKWYGETEHNIKELFRKAKISPISVIFFDEFDAIGRKRNSDDTDSSSIVPELLAQLQGFEQSNNIVIPLAATNRPWDIDSALLRPGRFDERIYIPLPDIEARSFIVNNELNGLPFESDKLHEIIVENTEGFNGADVVEFCEQIKMILIRKSIEGQEEIITREDIQTISVKVKSSVSTEDLKTIKQFM